MPITIANPDVRVELIYDADCPNIISARQLLLKTFAAIKKTASWVEWDRADPDSPEYVQHYGSPTILVNGQDVMGETNTDSHSCCRVYYDGEHYQGVPSLSAVQSAIASHGHTSIASQGSMQVGLVGIAGVLPSIGAALLPKLFCPACWPVYSALLSAVGISFINYTPYLLPLTVGFLATSLIALAFRAKQRHGYKPFSLGVLAATVILIGKFGFGSDNAMYMGISTLVLASFWNAWPIPRSRDTCSNCYSSTTT